MSPGATVLRLTDPESLHDLGRYAARARSLDEAGAMRLQCVGAVLAAWVGVLPGTGLLGEGTVLGLRTLALAEPSEVDVCVPAAAVGDRTHRPGAGADLSVPPTTLTPRWAALTPPRSGWQAVGRVTSATLVAAATHGIEEIATGAPQGSGALAVEDLRARVWGRRLDSDTEAGAGQPPVGSVGALPRGAAFAAYALGFLTPDGGATAARSGRWWRLSTPAGHVLAH